MKRSEMIEKLEHRILTGPLRKSAKHLASDYIAVLEEAGMLPPEQVKHWESGHGSGRYSMGNNWEKEGLIMAERMKLEGSMVAMVTPFADGEIDYDALGNLIEFQIDGGTQGIVPCGTTGESPTLSHAEHRQVIEKVVQAAAGRVKVVAGTGSNSTREALELHFTPPRATVAPQVRQVEAETGAT